MPQNAGDASAPSAPGLTLVPPVGTAASGYFTGLVTVTSPFGGTGDARVGGATVSFEPGGRSNWHSHPLWQLLSVTAEERWAQAEGAPVRAVQPGDVIWTGPDIKHWHGATKSSGMAHVSVTEVGDGRSVTWLEPVSDEQYRGPQ